MPEVDVVDMTWIGVPAARVASLVAEPARWAEWWPELRLAVDALRGALGVRWHVNSAPGGASGRMEIWLKSELDGVLAYFILALDYPDDGAPSAAECERLVTSYRQRAKKIFWAVGDELDDGRMRRLTCWQ